MQNNLKRTLKEFFPEEGLISSSYARYYFGREVLVHLLMLIGTAFFIRHRKGNNSSTKTVLGTLGRRKIEVSSESIYWIEADDHYLRLHCEDFELITRSTLEKMTSELAPDFVRIHRKYLVNRKVIVAKERLQRDEYVVLSSGEKLKVGRSFTPVTLNGSLEIA